MSDEKGTFKTFAPETGLEKDYPLILTVTPDSENTLLKDGKVLRRKMREATCLDSEDVKVQTPDANSIIHYHLFIKRATGVQYRLAFTKDHIYVWNPSTYVWDLIFTTSSSCTNWESSTYNDKVIATNYVDKILVWSGSGDFAPLDSSSGIEYGRSYSNETVVDLDSNSGQKVLKIKDTSGYIQDDKVIIDKGGDREEEGVVDTIQAGISLTLVDNLTYTHTADARTTVDSNSSEGQKVLNVLSTTGYSEDEVVNIDPGGDRAEQRKIYTIQDGISLTFTVNLSYEHTQAQGDIVVGSGNHNDEVKEYTSYYLTKAKFVDVYENYLILGYTYEDGDVYPQRMRWDAIGEEENWLGGDSGSKEIGKADFLKGFGHYQGFLIGFKQKSYFRLNLTASRLVFNMIQLSHEIGLECSHSVVNDDIGNLYWFASDHTFKQMGKGTISKPIQTRIVDLIQPNYVSLIRSAFINATVEVMWAIPWNSNKNNKAVVYKEEKWLILDLAIPAFGQLKEA